ncbi:hypothetical protein DFR59_10653 [Falsibacillus pallidus]|uniref:Uncharacterized protein n=2 Tax=Falsibacillus pallidus TaxID=493781 RepID=A0A370GHN7_9BACI|nr:hypothetical protein DFR59_10653 [Falsibacillus pallidus]
MSIGPFFILLPMIKKLRTNKADVQQAHLQTFRSAVRLAKHAGHVLVMSGVLLVILSSWKFSSSWISATIIVLVGSLFFLARAFSPLLKKYGQGEDEEQLGRKLMKATWIYIVLLLLMLWFMVTKPVLW